MHSLEFFERKLLFLSQSGDFTAEDLLFVSLIQKEIHDIMMKLRDDMTLRKLMIEREKHHLLKQENSDKNLFSLANNELVKSKMKTVEFFSLVWKMTPMISKMEVDEKIHEINELMIQWRGVWR